MQNIHDFMDYLDFSGIAAYVQRFEFQILFGIPNSLMEDLRRFSQNCQKRLLASSFLFVRPSFRMEQLFCH